MGAAGCGQPFWPGRGLAHLVFFLLHITPESARRRLARWLAPRMLRRNPKRRRIIDTNLQYCFPELDAAQRDALALAFAERWTFSILDYGSLWSGAVDDLDRRVRVEGRELLEAALASRRPVMLLTPHTVGLEQAALHLARHYPLCGVTRENNAGLGSWVLRRLRARYSARALDRNASMFTVLGAIKSGQVLYYLPDEDHGARRRSVFVPYFGRNVNTVLGSGRLVALSGTTVLPCMTQLDVATGMYTVRIDPPVAGLENRSPEDICAILRRELERLIRSAPQDYQWSIRMFQTLECGDRNADYRADRSKPAPARIAREAR